MTLRTGLTARIRTTLGAPRTNRTH